MLSKFMYKLLFIVSSWAFFLLPTCFCALNQQDFQEQGAKPENITVGTIGRPKITRELNMFPNPAIQSYCPEEYEDDYTKEYRYVFNFKPHGSEFSNMLGVIISPLKLPDLKKLFVLYSPQEPADYEIILDSSARFVFENGFILAPGSLAKDHVEDNGLSKIYYYKLSFVTSSSIKGEDQVQDIIFSSKKEQSNEGDILVKYDRNNPNNYEILGRFINARDVVQE